MFGIIYNKYLQEGEKFIFVSKRGERCDFLSAFVCVSLSAYDQEFRFMVYWILTPCDIQC